MLFVKPVYPARPNIYINIYHFSDVQRFVFKKII